MINSYKKGANAELEVAHLLEKMTGEFWARVGTPERGKLIAKGDVVPILKFGLNKKINQESWYFKNWYIDVKKHEKWHILDWYKKTKDDASESVNSEKKPLVIASQNNEDWFVFLSLSDFVNICELVKKSNF